MNKPFSRTFRVRWSELNARGHVDLAGYFHYIVETAWDWGAANGLSIVESEKLGFAWVMRETEINILRPLLPNEIFEFTIWLYKWRRVRGTRFFELRIKENDEVVAQGAQQVVSLDSNNMRPSPPPQDIMDNFLIENPRELEKGIIPKFDIQEEKVFATQREVEWRDLDTLDHVNNAVYAEYVEDAIALALDSVGWTPEKFKSQGLNIVYDRAHMKYLSSAIWGDELDVTTSLVKLKDTGGAFFVKIKRSADSEPIIECIVEWTLTERSSGEKQNLPKSLFHSLNERVAVSNENNS